MSNTEFVPDYSANVASQPEDWGFKTVATLSQPNMSYEFDEYIVWVDTSGALFYAHDSGCSCPTPFEGFREPADLQRITSANWLQFCDETSDWYDGTASRSRAFLATVEQVLLNPTTSAASVATHLLAQAEAKAKAEFRKQVLLGLSNCAEQISKVVDGVPYYLSSSSPLADIVEGLQETVTTDILVLGVYLTRMAEDAIAANAAAQTTQA